MTSKERVRAAVSFQPVDHVPSCIFDGGVWLTAQRGLSLHDFLYAENNGADILLDVYRETGTDICWVGNGLHSLGLKALGAKADYSRVGVSGEVGKLFEDISDIENHDISEIRPKLEADEDFQALLRQIRAVKAAVGDEKYVATVSGAPFTIAGMLIGVQTFMEAIFDEDEHLPALYDYAVALSVIGAEMFLEAGANLICLGDPVASGDLISQKMFEELALPLEKRAFEQIKGAEILLLHICGNTLPRLESLKTLPIQGFSLDSVDVGEAMRIADGKYAIFGNLSPFKVLQEQTPEQISALGRALCETAGKNGGFVLMPGCDITPATPLENITAMIGAPQ